MQDRMYGSGEAEVLNGELYFIYLTIYIPYA